MRKILLLAIFIINSFNIFGDWINKNNNFELSENVGIVRDIKILKEENLVIIINNENKIFKLKYDSGKILNILKIENHQVINCDAKISSDGKTTLISNIDSTNSWRHILNLSLIDNSSGTLLMDYSYIQSGYHSFKSYVKYFDYFNNELQIFINYYALYDGGSTQYEDYTGVLLFGKINDAKFEIIKNIENCGINYVFRNELSANLLIATYDRSSSSQTSASSKHKESQLILLNMINKNIDTLVRYNYSHNYYSGDGIEKGYNIFKGVDANIYKIYESNEKEIVYLNVNKNLIKFDLKYKKIIDSISNVFSFSNDIISPEGYFIYKFEKNMFQAKSIYKNEKNYEFQSDSTIILPSINVDFDNKNFIFSNLKGNLIKIKPTTMDELDSMGFFWNREWLYEGMEIDFIATTHYSNCKYSWQIDNGDLIETQDNKFSYIFEKSGKYSITLYMNFDDGKQLVFRKDSIIHVMPKLKPEFDFELLNDTLPLRVRLIDRTKSKIITKEWKFEENSGKLIETDIYEFIHPGVFSITLKIIDDYSFAELTKYDTICIGSIKPTVIEKRELINQKRYKAGFGDAFFSSSGFHYYFYEENDELNGPGVDIYVSNYLKNSNEIDTSSFRIFLANLPYYHPYCVSNFPNDKLITAQDNEDQKITIYDVSSKKKIMPKISSPLYRINSMKLTKDNKLFASSNDNIVLSNTDSVLSEISNSNLPLNKINYIDTLNNGLHYLGQVNDSTYYYKYFGENLILKFSRSFSLRKNIKINNILTLDANNIIIYGYIKDDALNKNFGIIIKYNPIKNVTQEIVVHSRRAIKKIVPLGSQYFAAIGANSGKQGYLLLDTNLSIIKDIRVDSLLGEAVGILADNKNIFIFTDEIIYKETMALGAKDGIITKVTVLELPEEVISSVNEQINLSVNKDQITLFPNPATDYITIDLERCATLQKCGTSTVEIYDVMGVLIQTTPSASQPPLQEGNLKIDISNLSPGVYFMKIVGSNVVRPIVEKFVKIN